MIRPLFRQLITRSSVTKLQHQNELHLISSVSYSTSNRVSACKAWSSGVRSTTVELLSCRAHSLPTPQHVYIPVRGKKSKKKREKRSDKVSVTEEEGQEVSSESETATLHEGKRGALEGNLEEGELVNMEAVTSRMDKIIDAFGKKLSSLRTGRTDPGMLDNIQVNAYGSKQSLSNIAQASLQSAKLLHVSVFDPSLIAEVEKAIRNSGMSLNPSVEGSTVKVPVPKTTRESREEVAKVAREARETTKRSILAVRGDAVKVIKGCKGEPGVSEDGIFQAQVEVDKEVEKMNNRIQEMFQKREKEILES